MASGTYFVDGVSPSVEQLKKVGFKFENYPGKEELKMVTLPEGWTIINRKIYDTAGNERGSYVEIDGVRTISLRTYYRPMLEPLEGNKYLVYFGNDNGPLFKTGVVDASEYYGLVSNYLSMRASRDWGNPCDGVQKSYSASLATTAKWFNEQVISVCDSVASASYPGWNDVNNYWPGVNKKEKHGMKN